eukprot:5779706-Lingulodinium_polyedra.AAC.1
MSKDRWVHLSFGNLSTALFYVLVLKPNVATVVFDGASFIHLDADTSKARHLWDVFHTHSFDKDWDMELWCIVSSNDRPADFVAGNVAVAKCEPEVVRK